MPSNLPVTLLTLGGGAVLVWAGLTKPAGGVFGELGRVLAGTPSALGTGPQITTGAYAGPVGGTVTPAADGAPAAGGSAGVLATAARYLGTPYRLPPNPPETFDCSSFTQWCYKYGAGVSLLRTAALQQGMGRSVASLDVAAPADLIFYGFPAHHVMLYVGNGRVIHAPNSRGVVRYEAVDRGQISNIRRIFGGGLST